MIPLNDYFTGLKMTFSYTLLAGAVVGLERTFYQVSGDVDVVEVCAIVYGQIIACPIEFLFNVNLTTSNGTAGNTPSITSLLGNSPRGALNPSRFLKCRTIIPFR